ncbi:MAG: iron complex transport system ATP-binding protein [Motiliproteus sp.]|jgi:iron complex transport system ATP-binding protein
MSLGDAVVADKHNVHKYRAELLRVEQLGIGIGERWFCRGLEQSFAAGQVWGVLGANGSGKTTLLHSLAGLRQPQTGQIRIDGQPLQQLDSRVRARQVGVLLQEASPAFPASVREVVLQGRYPHQSPWQWETAEDFARVDRALQQVGLAELGERDQQLLSGGERQRLKIASLLVQEPQLWLLDEPSNHLDLRHQVGLLQLLCDQVRQHQQLLIMSLHDLNLAARFCDHLLLMHRDGSVQAGCAENLLTEAVLSRLYGHPIRRIMDQDRPVFIAL